MAARRDPADHGSLTASCWARGRFRSYVAGICNRGTAMTARKTFAALTAALMTLGGLASPVAALEPLSQERYINDRLIAARVADRIRRDIASAPFRIMGGRESLSITISIGVAATNGVGDTPEQLMKRADEGVYEAKAGGRNKVIARAA